MSVTGPLLPEAVKCGGGGEEEGVIFRVATCSCVSVCQCDVECVCVCMCDCSETSFMTLSHTSVHVEIW